MIDTTTRVAAALDGLLELCRAACPEAEVLDGPSEFEYTEPAVVIVGISPDDDTAAVDILRSGTGPGPRQVEDASISCEISTWTGDVALKPARDAAVALFAAIEEQLATWGDTDLERGRTLYGAVDIATLGPDVRVLQAAAEEGAGCAIQFTVTYKAAL